ncbi:MAG: DUF309 domain-containing protein [Calditrichaeota bacterium]|nr:MAG: DUF309 domain-containing protein [Calditrichota bacterium]
MSIHNPDRKRYTTIPFPARKFIPGKSIHPDRDPHGSHIPSLPKLDKDLHQDNWMNSQHYLYAVDLFNFGFWWEAHEVLEKIWVHSGKKSSTAIFIQGLIQIAAALLKDSQNISQGAKNLQSKGLPKLKSQSGVYLGIDVGQFVSEIERYFSGEVMDLPEIILQEKVEDI